MLSSPLPARAAAAAALAALVGPAHAHLIMANPVPYSHATLANAPLSSATYPCQRTGDPAAFYATAGIDNTYAAGSTQTLAFTGAAVHGGGSCQLALASDLQPSPATDWRVILSLEGGCPTTDLSGAAAGASAYNWTVPASLAPGRYSFAWTWISKQAGQAEYYMNCAPITVTPAPAGTSQRRDDAAADAAADTQYPELFVANLADINECKTSEGSDYVYPFGGVVARLGSPAAALQYSTITSSSCVPKGQTQGGNYLPTASVVAGGGSNATAAAAAATSTEAAVSAATTASPTASDGSGSATTPLVTATASSAGETVYVSPIVPSSTSRNTTLATGSVAPSSSSSSSSSAAATTTVTTSSTQGAATTTATATSSAAASSSAAAATTAPAASTTRSPSSAPTTGTPATATGAGGSATAGTRTGTCATEGEFNCVGSRYQQCASGAWTSMQALPGGTACTQGLSAGLWARGLRRGLGAEGFVKVVRRGRGAGAAAAVAGRG